MKEKKYYRFYDSINTYLGDVLKTSKLYMSDYISMQSRNDKSEGIYLLDSMISIELRKNVHHEKKKLMICCVTNKVRNGHMWKEFANNGDGLCIAFHVTDSNSIKSFKIRYQNNRPI